MYKHILIGTDGSETAQKGMEHGLSLAKALGAKVTVLTVTEPFPFLSGVAGAGWAPMPADIEAYQAGQKDWAAKVLANAKEAGSRGGVEVVGLHVDDSWPAAAIVDTADAQGADLIVMASHGRRGLGRLLLGSQTSEVLTQSKVPVLVVR